MWFSIANTPKVATAMMTSPTWAAWSISPGPVPYLTHYAIERDDIDGVMKAAGSYLAENPGVQISGPGRHQLGGNVFWNNVFDFFHFC